MKYISFIAAVLVCITTQAQVTGIQHVIVIGCDGMSPDGVRKANTPNMDKMMAGGAFTLRARGVLPTVSSPNWASMIMGVGPEAHGITANEWGREEYNLPPNVTGPTGEFPSIFEVVNKQKPNFEIGAIYNWDGFGRLFEKTAVDYDTTINSEYGTMANAINYFKTKKPNFLFIHLDNCDHAGHSLGHGSPGYYKAVGVADSLIGNMMDAVKDAGLLSSTVIIVTADHGGVQFGHGGESLAEIQIPFIVWGQGVKKGYEFKNPIYTYDNAATVAYLFGLKTPHAWVGRPAKAAFEGYTEDDDMFARFVVEGPEFLPKQTDRYSAGNIFVDADAKVELAAPPKGWEIRYTDDGTEPQLTSKIYTAPFIVQKTTLIKARMFNRAENTASLVTKANYRIVKSATANGINYKYYKIAENAEKLPDVSGLTPVATGKTYEISLDHIKNTGENFAVVYEGLIDIKTEGEYRFFTFSDDGSKLWIDDAVVVDNDGSHGTKEVSGSKNLKPGKHKIKAMYFQGGGGYWMETFYTGPGISKQVIPTDVLTPTN